MVNTMRPRTFRVTRVQLMLVVTLLVVTLMPLAWTMECALELGLSVAGRVLTEGGGQIALNSAVDIVRIDLQGKPL